MNWPPLYRTSDRALSGDRFPRPVAEILIKIHTNPWLWRSKIQLRSSNFRRSGLCLCQLRSTPRWAPRGSSVALNPPSPQTLHQKVLGAIGLQNKTCCDRSENDLKRIIELMYSLYCLTQINAWFALKIFEFPENKNEWSQLNRPKDSTEEVIKEIAASIVTRVVIFRGWPSCPSRGDRPLSSFASPLIFNP